jgi:zinc and cadmium transporter
MVLLAGIMSFFILEKLVLWHHCHSEDCEAHGRPGALVLIGHGFHSFVDGVAIGAAVQTSWPLGVSTAIAAFLAFDKLQGFLPYALTFAAASFLYISMADLMPDLHKGKVDGSTFKQLLLLVAGMATAYGLCE